MSHGVLKHVDYLCHFMPQSHLLQLWVQHLADEYFGQNVPVPGALGGTQTVPCRFLHAGRASETRREHLTQSYHFLSISRYLQGKQSEIFGGASRDGPADALQMLFR